MCLKFNFIFQVITSGTSRCQKFNIEIGINVELLTQVSVNVFRYVEANGKFAIAMYFAIWKAMESLLRLSVSATPCN